VLRGGDIGVYERQGPTCSLFPGTKPTGKCIPRRISLFVNEHKVTTESGPTVQFEAQRQEARRVFEEREVLLPHQFDLVDWPKVNQTLRDVPKMFQIFACKQVFDVSANNRFLHKRNAAPNNSPICNSCTIHEECAGHILSCPEEGRVQMLHKLAEELLDWLDDAGTPRDLTFLIVKYIKERGGMSMTEIVNTHQLPEEYLEFANALYWVEEIFGGDGRK
jgi:hypothetical protein